MQAETISDSQQDPIPAISSVLCQWELGAYQALRSMALAFKAQGVDQEIIANAVQTSLDVLTNDCPEENHTEQLAAAHALLSYTSVEETLQSLIDGALMDDDPDTAQELLRLIQVSAAPLMIDGAVTEAPKPVASQPKQ